MATQNPIPDSAIHILPFLSCIIDFISLKKNFPDFNQREIKIGTFGSTTAQAVRDAGLRLDLEAPTVQAPSMTAALDMFIKENNK